MPVPSGSPRGYLAPRNTPERDTPPCLLQPTQVSSGHSGGSEPSPTFGTHQIQAAARHSKERESFTCGLCRHLLSEDHQGPSNKHSVGVQRREIKLEKPSNVVQLPPPCFPGIPVHLLHGPSRAQCGHGMQRR